jgi:hypothetical protein
MISCFCLFIFYSKTVAILYDVLKQQTPLQTLKKNSELGRYLRVPSETIGIVKQITQVVKQYFC